MSILKYSREQIEEFVNSGMMRKEILKHYDVCKALSSGVTQEKAAEVFGLNDDSYVRKIKAVKCPECNKK